MVRPRNQTEDLSLSITKNYETLIKQTHTKPEETLQFKLAKSRETFSFKPPSNLGLHSNWMIRLTSLEVYSFIFNITKENNQFDLYSDTFDEFSIPELKDELKEILKF